MPRYCPWFWVLSLVKAHSWGGGGGDCSVILGLQKPWQEGEARIGQWQAWEPNPGLSCRDPDSLERGAQSGEVHTGLVQAQLLPSVLGQLGKIEQGEQYYSRSSRLQREDFQDSVCSQQDPRPWVQRKDRTGRGRRREEDLDKTAAKKHSGLVV